MKTAYKNIIAVGIGIGIGIVLLEIFLRMYNPFEPRLRGVDIVLPVYQQYVIENTSIPGLDPIIRHTKNSLGFRGENPPADIASRLSIIAVGGSTTEQFYISDGHTWVDRVGEKLKKQFPRLWINNAGLDGHSTFGHAILLEQYIAPLHPKIVLLLVGVNDIGRADLNQGVDDGVLKNTYRGTVDFMAKKSALANTILTIARALRARHAGVAHSFINIKNLSTLDLSPEFISEKLTKEKEYLAGYGNRMGRLISSAQKNIIQPILITQPMLWGAEKDIATHIDLGRVRISAERNGILYAKLLELYNEETRRIGKEHNVMVIDVARRMPHDSRYYYDGIHFSNEGAEKVGDIVAEELALYLKKYVGVY